MVRIGLYIYHSNHTNIPEVSSYWSWCRAAVQCTDKIAVWEKYRQFLLDFTCSQLEVHRWSTVFVQHLPFFRKYSSIIYLLPLFISRHWYDRISGSVVWRAHCITLAYTPSFFSVLKNSATVSPLSSVDVCVILLSSPSQWTGYKTKRFWKLIKVGFILS